MYCVHVLIARNRVDGISIELRKCVRKQFVKGRFNLLASCKLFSKWKAIIKSDCYPISYNSLGMILRHFFSFVLSFSCLSMCVRSIFSLNCQKLLSSLFFALVAETADLKFIYGQEESMCVSVYSLWQRRISNGTVCPLDAFNAWSLCQLCAFQKTRKTIAETL